MKFLDYNPDNNQKNITKKTTYRFVINNSLFIHKKNKLNQQHYRHQPLKIEHHQFFFKYS